MQSGFPSGPRSTAMDASLRPRLNASRNRGVVGVTSLKALRASLRAENLPEQIRRGRAQARRNKTRMSRRRAEINNKAPPSCLDVRISPCKTLAIRARPRPAEGQTKRG